MVEIIDAVAVDKNSRRRVVVMVVEVGANVAVMVVGLVLMGGRDLGVEVGVMRVGEAMVLMEKKVREGRRERKREFLCEVYWVFATWPYRLIFVFGLWMRKQPMVCKV